MSDLSHSKLRSISIGIALSNVMKNGDEIKVWLAEHNFGLDGELNHEASEESIALKDHDETDIKLTLKTSAGVKAKWLRQGQPNRLTAPNIRRGARVRVYQFDGVDAYYWEPYEDNSKRVALEHVTYRFAATNKDGQEPSKDNSYWCTVSTIEKLVVFETSKANGEKVAYHLSFDTGNGLFTVKDDKNNGFQINSEVKGGKVAFATEEGGYVSLEGRKLIIDVDEIIETAKLRQSNVDKTEVSGTTHNKGKISSDDDVTAKDISLRSHNTDDSHGAPCSKPKP